MKVTSTIITKVAESKTDNGSYHLEYNITDGVLEQVQTTVYKPSESEEQRVAVGSIFYDRGSVTVNMPFSNDIAKYVADFVALTEMILSEVATVAAAVAGTENK